MVKVKICGITNKIDGLNAADLGADMLGFVFYKKSKRYVEPKLAQDIINELPEAIEKVGIFVDEKKEDVLRIAEDSGLTALQFHGDETPGYCDSFKGSYKVIKAFRIKDRSGLWKINDYDTDFYLLDAYSPRAKGGIGETFDWGIIRDFEMMKPLILSGGLNAGNVSKAISSVAPYGVDVSSGVEASPGKKDLGLMKNFIDKARKA
jgi:phosphoribosylanthranilate isomerase